MASIHQNAGLANRPQRSSRHTIQSPVAPANRNRDTNLRRKASSIASNSGQPLFMSPDARASGSPTSVTKATPPIQWATNTTCNAQGDFDVVDHEC